jgi:hypothetical protein
VAFHAPQLFDGDAGEGLEATVVFAVPEVLADPGAVQAGRQVLRLGLNRHGAHHHYGAENH